MREKKNNTWLDVTVFIELNSQIPNDDNRISIYKKSNLKKNVVFEVYEKYKAL